MVPMRFSALYMRLILSPSPCAKRASIACVEAMRRCGHCASGTAMAAATCSSKPVMSRIALTTPEDEKAACVTFGYFSRNQAAVAPE